MHLFFLVSYTLDGFLLIHGINFQLYCNANMIKLIAFVAISKRNV